MACPTALCLRGFHRRLPVDTRLSFLLAEGGAFFLPVFHVEKECRAACSIIAGITIARQSVGTWPGNDTCNDENDGDG